MSSALRVTLVAAVIVLPLLALVWWLPTPGDQSIRLLEDDHDRHVYYQRGSFLPREAVPYLEVHSEYPELATWFFALPFFLIDAPADPAAYVSAKPEDLERHRPVIERYFDLHSTFMAICLILLVLVSAKICERLGRDPRFALLALLPASLYFTFSRYDVLPVLLISTSLLALLSRRHLLAIAIVSCAVLTKWYAILFLPYYLNYAKRKLGKPVLPGLALSASIAFLVVGITFVTGGSRYVELKQGRTPQIAIAALPAAPLPAALEPLVARLPEGARDFATGGLRAALSPYLHQGSRTTNPGGLYDQMKVRWFDIAYGSDLEKRILLALTILQFAAIVFGFLVPMREDMQLVRWLCFATACFVLFAKFYSPQWVMWTTALALLFARSKALLATVIALEVFIYVQFAIVRGTPLRGERLPDLTFRFTDFWYHLYDVRFALTALFTLLVAMSIFAHRGGRRGRGETRLEAVP
jgi:hypothetical protein